MPGHQIWTTSIIGFVIVSVMCVLFLIFFLFLQKFFPVLIVAYSAEFSVKTADIGASCSEVFTSQRLRRNSIDYD